MSEKVSYKLPEQSDIRSIKNIHSSMLGSFMKAKGGTLEVDFRNVREWDSSLGQLVMALMRECSETATAFVPLMSETLPSVPFLVGCDASCASCGVSGTNAQIRGQS